MTYDVEVTQTGKSLGHLACDTRTSTGRVCGDSSSGCEYKLACELPPLDTGEVSLRVEGRYPEPARIKSVERMSLFVRD